MLILRSRDVIISIQNNYFEWMNEWMNENLFLTSNKYKIAAS